MGNNHPAAEDRPRKKEKESKKLEKRKSEKRKTEIRNNDDPNRPPTPPPKDKIIKHIYRALHTYTANNDDELSFKYKDIITVLGNDEGKEWLNGKNERTGLSGLVPKNYVVKDDGSIENKEYFFDICRSEAESLLQVMGNSHGTFLIRPSTEENNLALSVRCDVNGRWIVRHYKIVSKNKKWYINESKQFDKVDELIKYHKEKTSSLNTELSNPLPREPPDVPFKEFEVKSDNFILYDTLGKGNFGEVKKAKWGEKAKSFVAIKIIQPNKMSNEDFIEEAKVMHQLTHKNIVKLLAVCTQSMNNEIYIVTEYMDKGALLEHIRGPEGITLEFIDLIEFIQGIVAGMEYLEQKNFVHRDLRAANILVNSRKMAKVADFGLTRFLEESIYTAQNTLFPVRWTAPEAARNRIFSTKSDVWSFGIVIYEIVTYGATPYQGMGNMEVRKKVEEENYRLPNPNGEIFLTKRSECPDQLYELMLECWNKDSENRPTFESLKNQICDWKITFEPKYVPEK